MTDRHTLFSMTGPIVAVLSAVLSWILIKYLAPAFENAGMQLPTLTAWWLRYHYLGWLVPIAAALTWWRLSGHPARARSGALLTGANTVLLDDPSLSVRLGDDTPFVPPLRVVLDAGLATVARGKVRDASAPTLYIHAPDAKPPRELEAHRAVAPVTAGRFDLAAMLKLLAEREINEVQVEAGATLAGAFLAAGLADEVLLYVAPVLLGENARPLFAGLGIETLAQKLQLQLVEARAIGEDQRLLLRPSAR